MNKRAGIDPFTVFITIMIIAALIIVPAGYEKDRALDKACQDLGFKEYKSWNRQATCTDTWGNVVFVKMDCEGFWKPKCSAHKIKIGEVWGVIKE